MTLTFKATKQFLILVSILALFVGVTFISLIEPNLPRAIPHDPNAPDYVFEGVNITHLDEGVVTWELDADAAEISKKTGEATLVQVEGRFIEAESVVAIMRGPIATLNMQTADMHMNDAVVNYVAEAQPVTLNASELIWNAMGETLEGSGLIKIDAGNFILTGDYFNVSVPQKKLVVSANSEATIYQE